MHFDHPLKRKKLLCCLVGKKTTLNMFRSACVLPFSFQALPTRCPSNQKHNYHVNPPILCQASHFMKHYPNQSREPKIQLSCNEQLNSFSQPPPVWQQPNTFPTHSPTLYQLIIVLLSSFISSLFPPLYVYTPSAPFPNTTTPNHYH